MKPVRHPRRRPLPAGRPITAFVAAHAAARTAAALAAALLLGGYALPKISLPSLSLPEPWVKPYERERLADPLMKFQRDGLSDKHFEHVREVREGSRGGTGVQGGGCGCN
jgi:hypothetical protein